MKDKVIFSCTTDSTEASSPPRVCLGTFVLAPLHVLAVAFSNALVSHSTDSARPYGYSWRNLATTSINVLVFDLTGGIQLSGDN